jgi:hypothetical protein
MSLAHSPSLVLPGLSLCLDAANSKSYPGSGTTWTDLSGRGNNGTLVNGVGYNSSNLGSLSFDGVNDTVNFGDILDIGLSNWTVSTWIKSTTHHFGRIVAKNDVGASGWWISASTNGSFALGIDDVFASSSVYNYNVAGWINLVGVWNRNAFGVIYANGNSLGNIVDISSKSSTNLQTTFNLRVSSRDAGDGWFNGNISQVSIYNRALSAAEIQQNFNALRSRFSV